jgi:threonine aldolase
LAPARDDTGVVDLRSDTVTRPTRAMRVAMAEAEVGDDGYGEDPTVNRLEALAAALLGKEAAVFTPSGTMANQLALLVLGRPGTEVLCGARSHVLRHEDAATAGNSGVQLHPLADAGGVLDPAAVAAAVEGRAHHLPEVSAVAIENTAMAASGRPWRTAELVAIADVARAGGLAVHCDGARLWNAAVATGVAPRELVAGTDTTMFCLSKGLGAPVGSLLCGTRETVARARAGRRRLGGGMRQAGVLAAAGIVALETMVERLADDHVRARVVAEALAECFPGSVDPTTVETNVVCGRAAALPEGFLDRLRAYGVLGGTIDPDTVRLVTHLDVDDDDIERARTALLAVARDA